jgi:hypothetical protein
MDLRQWYARAEECVNKEGATKKIVRLDFRQAKCCALPSAHQQTETTQIVFM